MRIDKFLSQLKYCTRSQTKAFLKNHVTMIKNERVLNASYIFNPDNEKVNIDGIDLYYKNPLHLMLNKPKGYVSATTDQLHPCVTNLLKEPYSRFDFKIAGRLDIDTEGLLILTTDGNFIHKITHPNQHLEKVYVATLDRDFTHQSELLKGVQILDGRNQPYLAVAIDIKVEDKEVTITIDEGKFHQVKRMFLILGYEVLYLKRIKIGKLELNDLALGEYREVGKEELYD